MLRAVAAAAATSMAAPSPTGGQMATEWRLDIGCKVLKPGDWLYNSCEYVPPMLHSERERFFTTYPANKAWLGNPVAFVIKRAHAEWLEETVRQYVRDDPHMPADVLLSLQHTPNHWIARMPQLCYDAGINGSSAPA